MRIRHLAIILLVAGSLSIVGCGRGGPKTHRVNGLVEHTSGDVELLVGSTIEVALVGDPSVRASGEIGENGYFKLQSLHNGATITGAREGTYQARIILSDDDRAKLRQAAKAVAPRFRDFKTSGLIVTVPASNEVTLTVSDR